MKNYNKYFQLKMKIRDILIKYHLKCKSTFDLMHYKVKIMPTINITLTTFYHDLLRYIRSNTPA